MTKSQVEIDLIIERPGKPLALVEIKSTDTITNDDFKVLEHFEGEFKTADLFIWSRDPRRQTKGRIQAVNWTEGILSI